MPRRIKVGSTLLKSWLIYMETLILYPKLRSLHPSFLNWNHTEQTVTAAMRRKTVYITILALPKK